jgi:hypothetical protein
MSNRLNQIQILSPCPVAWDSMKGDEKVRHCSQCDCKVYDLSAHAAADGERLLDQANNGLCVQITRRPNGTVVTADAQPPRRTFRRWLLFSAASVFGLAGCENSGESNVSLGGSVAKPGQNNNSTLRGEVAPQNPPTRGIELRGKIAAPSLEREGGKIIK